MGGFRYSLFVDSKICRGGLWLALVNEGSLYGGGEV